MADTIFSGNNPNADIFIIEQDEGNGDFDDRRVASIGDATLNHVQKLGNSRLIYDSFICMPDGNLFAVEDNLSWNEITEFNIKSENDIDKYLRDNKIPEKYRGIYIEALQNQLDKGESEDVLDQRDHLVSYEDWEANPQLMSHWD